MAMVVKALKYVSIALVSVLAFFLVWVYFDLFVLNSLDCKFKNKTEAEELALEMLEYSIWFDGMNIDQGAYRVEADEIKFRDDGDIVVWVTYFKKETGGEFGSMLITRFGCDIMFSMD